MQRWTVSPAARVEILDRLLRGEPPPSEAEQREQAPAFGTGGAIRGEEGDAVRTDRRWI